MKTFSVFLCTLLLCFGIVGAANATLLDFDELAPGDYASLVYADVTITELHGGPIRVLASGAGGTGYTSPVNNIAASQWTAGYGLQFEFTNLVSSVKITGGDAGGDTDRFSLEVFDSSWNSLGIVDTGVFQNADPVNPIPGTTYQHYRTLSINADGIKYAKVVQVIWGQGFDDLEFDAVPTPEAATMIFMSCGILGLAAVRRKFKK
jgi:hypothetical protein